MADKTNWQAMLKGDAQACDMEQARLQLLATCADEIDALQRQFGLQAISVLEAPQQTLISYPVLEYPGKVSLVQPRQDSQRRWYPDWNQGPVPDLRCRRYQHAQVRRL